MPRVGEAVLSPHRGAAWAAPWCGRGRALTGPFERCADGGSRAVAPTAGAEAGAAPRSEQVPGQRGLQVPVQSTEEHAPRHHGPRASQLPPRPPRALTCRPRRRSGPALRLPLSADSAHPERVCGGGVPNPCPDRPRARRRERVPPVPDPALPPAREGPRLHAVSPRVPCVPNPVLCLYAQRHRGAARALASPQPPPPPPPLHTPLSKRCASPPADSTPPRVPRRRPA